jgi:hypothetical protein
MIRSMRWYWPSRSHLAPACRSAWAVLAATLAVLNSTACRVRPEHATKALAATTAPQPMSRVKAPDLRPRMHSLLNYIERIFAERYAPASYKRKRFGWHLGAELGRIRQWLRRAPRTSKAAFRVRLRHFFRSMRDLHTGVHFSGKKAVWLGLHLRRTDKGYVIAWVDRRALPRGRFPFGPGDRVLTLGRRPVLTVVKDIARRAGIACTSRCKQAFAEWFTTYRSRSDLNRIPRAGSPLELGLLPRGAKQPKRVNLRWLDDERVPPSSRCPFWGKTREGFLPPLGPLRWDGRQDGVYPAYVFTVGGRTYGYLRFHTYALESKLQNRAIAELGATLAHFRRHKIEALVVDQLGNGGGNFLFAFSLLARLIDTPLYAPRQHYMITKNSKRVVGLGSVSLLADLGRRFAGATTAAKVRALLANDPLLASETYLPPTLSTARSLGRFGAALTRYARKPGLTPPHFQLLERVYPYGPRQQRYTGPMLLLVDEMNISAAEYTAMTLADNRRALVLGTTTAGAGGDQRRVMASRRCTGPSTSPHGIMPCVPPTIAEAMRALGVVSFSYTTTLGVRVGNDGKPRGVLENSGLRPDHQLPITAADLAGSFGPFRARLQTALAQIARR